MITLPKLHTTSVSPYHARPGLRCFEPHLCRQRPVHYSWARTDASGPTNFRLCELRLIVFVTVHCSLPKGPIEDWVDPAIIRSILLHSWEKWPLQESVQTVPTFDNWWPDISTVWWENNLSKSQGKILVLTDQSSAETTKSVRLGQAVHPKTIRRSPRQITVGDQCITWRKSRQNLPGELNRTDLWMK